MKRVKDLLNNLFRGRYGSDKFNVFLLTLALVLSAVNYLWVSSHFVRSTLMTLSNISLMTVLYRSLSRNITKRYEEEVRFIKATKPIRGFFAVMKLRLKDRDHRYIKCKNCGNYLRVPKGAGRIKITCNHCNHKFTKRV